MFPLLAFVSVGDEKYSVAKSTALNLRQYIFLTPVVLLKGCRSPSRYGAQKVVCQVRPGVLLKGEVRVFTHALQSLVLKLRAVLIGVQISTEVVPVRDALDPNTALGQQDGGVLYP